VGLCRQTTLQIRSGQTCLGLTRIQRGLWRLIKPTISTTNPGRIPQSAGTAMLIAAQNIDQNRPGATPCRPTRYLPRDKAPHSDGWRKNQQSVNDEQNDNSATMSKSPDESFVGTSRSIRFYHSPVVMPKLPLSGRHWVWSKSKVLVVARPLAGLVIRSSTPRRFSAVLRELAN
jgi:hypothetical protein